MLIKSLTRSMLPRVVIVRCLDFPSPVPTGHALDLLFSESQGEAEWERFAHIRVSDRLDCAFRCVILCKTTLA